jgi:hypothetical protein
LAQPVRQVLGTITRFARENSSLFLSHQGERKREINLATCTQYKLQHHCRSPTNSNVKFLKTSS